MERESQPDIAGGVTKKRFANDGNQRNNNTAKHHLETNGGCRTSCDGRQLSECT